MKTSTILKLAKKKLRTGREKQDVHRHHSFVCTSIWAAADGLDFDDEKKALKVTTRIERALGWHSIQEWLLRKAKAHSSDVDDYKTIQTYRHRWLGALIAEYEAKGD